jgi:hypothetical protein
MRSSVKETSQKMFKLFVPVAAVTEDLSNTRKSYRVQLLRLYRLSYIGVKVPQVGDSIQEGDVGHDGVFAQGILVAFQRPLVHRLGFFVSPLVRVEEAEIVDGVKRRRVLWSPRLLVAF